MNNTQLEALLTTLAQKERELLPRDYELEITACAKQVTATTRPEYESYLGDRNNPLDNRFSCFFILFTYYRKNGYITEMENATNVYAYEFRNFFLFDHIELMSKIKVSTISAYEGLLKESTKYIDKYSQFVGFLNQYVELCARYFELHLDQRKVTLADGSKDFSPLLTEALDCAEKCCELNGTYAKIYANRGRIYALMGRYDDAERSIMHAISIVPDDNYRQSTVSSFENSYANIASIAAYDNATGEIETMRTAVQTAKDEISEIRAENLRNISIVSAAFALLLSGIQAFATISDFSTIGRVIIMYAGLFIFAIGFICLVTSLYATRHFKKKLWANVLSVAFALCGLIMFFLALFL